MRTVLAVVVCGVVLTAAACEYGSDRQSAGAPDGTPAAPSPSGTFGAGKVLIDTGDDSVLIDVEVAESNAEHRLGLMGRESLAPDRGMVFMFFEPTTSSFWMKNTLIPLSIAFFDDRGKIVAILDMEPCTEDPCPLYDPNATYFGALEVNQGAFDRWGVQVGDSIQIVR